MPTNRSAGVNSIRGDSWGVMTDPARPSLRSGLRGRATVRAAARVERRGGDPCSPTVCDDPRADDLPPRDPLVCVLIPAPLSIYSLVGPELPIIPGGTSV